VNNFNCIALAAITLLGSGCASIVSGQNQSVSVETRTKQGQSLLGANCKLTNNKGTWFVTSPGSVTVRRSYEDMLINCDKEGQEPGIASAKSSTKAMAFGNILFGGGIGAGVDIATGAAYDYPTLFTVVMGSNTKIVPPPSDKDKEQSKPPAAASVTPAVAETTINATEVKATP
jgi:hypothetical protein